MRSLTDRALAQVAALAKDPKYNYRCVASEAKRRAMMARKGRPCGERSLGRVLRAAAKAGRVGRRRVAPGHYLPGHHWTRWGRTIYWPLSRQEQRANARAKRKLEQRAPEAPAPKRVRPEQAPPAPAPSVERPRLRVGPSLLNPDDVERDLERLFPELRRPPNR